MTFAEMTRKFGHTMALDILLAVEKMAGIEAGAAQAKPDHEQRLVRALAELDRVRPVDRAEYHRLKQQEFLSRQNSDHLF